MGIFLRQEDVVRLLPVSEAIDSLEKAFKEQGNGTGLNHPRFRAQSEGLGVNMMVGVLGGLGVAGWKGSGGNYGNTMVWLYGGENKEFLAVMEASELGQIRTGAASGLATKYMARKEASSVGVIGTGHQAISQLTAVCAVRSIKTIKAFSRNPDRREEFCRRMSDLLGIEVIPTTSAREAVKGTDIAIAITNVRTLDPVILGEWLEPGMHLNAAGANSLNRRELDDLAVTRSSIIAADAKEQAMIECADLVLPIDSGLMSWDNVLELGQIVSGRNPGRTNAEEITLFESQGIGLEDVAVAAHIYEKATADGSGIKLPF
jgi:alanine dehydrogenase